jgi:hypothetical protein
VANLSDVAALRARLEPHGYHVFLQPDRPSGWLVIVQGGKDHGRDPITSRAATRAEALQVATRLFMNHRLTELDTAIRQQGLVPPVWDGTQEGHLDALAAYARANGVAA